jgi:hypothetical protein
MQNAEQMRLESCRKDKTPWRKWGPYLSERQWGTVREDYSASGDAWNYFSHDQARSRAYRWGEDGIAGISDDQQLLCFAIALWNGKDAILKERMFGLTNSEGNHGEDVKEYYFYLDSTPTHSYMRYLYKYPQAAYPYEQLVAVNRQRGRHNLEYELLDTGVFDQNRYFDVLIEYAKATPEDILIRITVSNRGPEPAPLDVVPTLWFRNTWSQNAPDPVKPELGAGQKEVLVVAQHPALGERFLIAERELPVLFVDNETNEQRIFGRSGGAAYPKDGINDFVVGGRSSAVNPARKGTKAGVHWHTVVPAGGEAVLRLRLTDRRGSDADPAAAFERVMAQRKADADEFYAAIIPSSLSSDEALVVRQAFAGMLWSKQCYIYDIHRWLIERGTAPRNDQWRHMDNADVISMPDKWEYPWYAAWDLAFHTVTLGVIDEDFAKAQLGLMLSERYLHPNGQIPAYEWNFGDVNPPVHAWATVFIHKIGTLRGDPDPEWLKHQFSKLVFNFGWWINRKDRDGRNLFEGGFLGLDNIGVFDRSAPLPTGGHLEQADGTAWMAMFCQNMLEIVLELARTDPLYQDMVFRFVQHFMSIAAAMAGQGAEGMWDDADGFFYDVLRFPDGHASRMKVRSIVGLLPLCAAAVLGDEHGVNLPKVEMRIGNYLRARPELLHHLHDIGRPGHAGRRLLSMVDEDRLRRILAVMLNESEFLGPHGIRSVSRFHAAHPYVLQVGNQTYRVDYLPAESDTGMFGGNSNWRGPVWMPINALLIRALLNYFSYYGMDFTVECPTGSGKQMHLFDVAREIARRLAAIFVRGPDGRRPVFGGARLFQEDPSWRDHLLFYEYFHGDNGAGIGASHQTGWTGLIATLMDFFGTVSADIFLKAGLGATVAEGVGAEPAPSGGERIVVRRAEERKREAQEA